MCLKAPGEICCVSYLQAVLAQPPQVRGEYEVGPYISEDGESCIVNIHKTALKTELRHGEKCEEASISPHLLCLPK